MNSIDEHFRNAVSAYQGVEVRPESEVPPVVLERLFRAQVQSRHLDFAARWLQSEGAGYYTIGSAGHESNAALGLLSRVDDPALLHYRSGGFYAARAQMAGHSNGVRDVLMSLTCSTEDPISGGRHKVFGHPDLNIIPQTSTISSHIPRSVGLAFALGLSRADQTVTPWSDDAVVICSFGDASVNHSTATGGFNAAGYMSHRGLECPVLFVCEDNDIGISTRTPEGWTEAALSSLPGVDYWSVEGADPESLLRVTEQAVDTVRVERRPGVLHLRTVRFMGHAGSDAEIAYRTHTEIVADYMRDPVLKTAERLIDQGIRTSAEILQDYEQSRDQVMDVARELIDTSRLKTPHDVMKPLSLPTPESSTTVVPSQRVREQTWGDRLPEDMRPMTLAQAINTTLIDQMAHDRQVLVFGEDVGTKGGVYGVTRGLRRRFGGRRVFDTLLDEQTILGTALGAALVGYTPVPEIQYLAYLHNAEDQLRGEAATLRFFSAGQYQNGMVVRIAGLAYQKGFGGHFHNDNSLAVLLDIPGVIVVVPSHPAEVPELLRSCFDLAQRDGRVCIFVEPIALYHTRDLHEPGDGLWTAGYRPPSEPTGAAPLREITRHGDGRDLLMVTFGNGLPMSLRAARTLADAGVATTTVDLRWLAPLPEEALLSAASEFSAVLIVDETRRSGGVSEHIVAALIDGGYGGRLARITSADSFIPLGPAAHTVLLGEDDIVQAAEDLLT